MAETAAVIVVAAAAVVVAAVSVVTVVAVSNNNNRTSSTDRNGINGDNGSIDISVEMATCVCETAVLTKFNWKIVQV
jgi:hypothetical protein